ncbi:cyclic pyranopterin monophosphate synthase MoaC [Parolsenella catena]|uniref:cyclic pyranopterin monophosphate synthase MoaC n=1 Tax=Parolsenella catena TaxID=2003188 RepID=UPI003A521EB8
MEQQDILGTQGGGAAGTPGREVMRPATSASIRDAELTHVNEQGRARMVDVGAKPVTARVARAAGKVLMAPSTLELVRSGGTRKGDVLAVAQVAGIMAAKRTWELVPMCHQVPLSGVDIGFAYESDGIAIEATARCKGETGVEMEALTAVSVASLSIYDIYKSHQRDMVIERVRLMEKDGGRSGHFVRED